jgi:phage/plasmid-associated DNA primase
MKNLKSFDSNIEYNELKEQNNLSTILNIKNNENSKEYIKLTDFLKNFEITKQDENYKNKMNICNVFTKKTYSLDDENIAIYMDLLEQCRLKKLKLNFTELQQTDIENNKGSGIMIDFDILTKNENSTLNLINFNDLILHIMKIIKNTVNLKLTNNINDDYEVIDNEFETLYQYIIIIKKEKPILKDSINLFKDGFHILIPGIKITREVKKYIIKQMLISNEIQCLFKSNNLNLELKEILDTNSTSVPVHFFGNCKTGSIPYILDNVYRVSINNDGITNPVNVTNMFNEQNINLCYDFSINFINKYGILLSKKFYKPHQHLYDDIQLYNEQYKLNDNDEEMDEINNDIALKEGYIPDTKYTKGLLRCLSIERLNDRNKWRNIIYALSNTSKDFKSLAKWVSKRNPEKWDSTSFENLWTEATTITKENVNKLTFRSLIYWAKEDDFEQYELLNNESIKSVINNDIHNRILVGDLQHYQFAKYLFHMFKDKFVTDYENKEIQWYEFVLPTDKYIKGQLYKWRLEESRPENLITYMSTKLVLIFDDIINEIDLRIANEEEKNIIDYLTLIKKKVINSVKHLYTNAFKNCIIKEADSLFRKRGFIQSLNSDKDIIGVGNGILKLSSSPEMIETLHSYPISHYTDVDYIPYDENNIYIKKIIAVIKTLFPDDEMDAYEYILYYLAACLDGKPKQSIIFIIIGCGSNGKSFLLEFIKSILGEQYGTKMPLTFLTDKRTKSSSADPSFMNLEHARLAHYSEANPNDELNTAKVKEITGQETLSGRNLFEKQKSFRPACMHLVTTNYHFGVKTTDHGTWRRIRTYKFKNVFTPDPNPDNKYEKKMDPEVGSYIYDDKLKQAFLSILVEYYKRLQSKYNGNLLNVISKTIDYETNEYRNNEDVVNKFIDERAVISPKYKGMIMESIDAYKRWFTTVIESDINVKLNQIPHLLKNSKIGKYYKTECNAIYLTGIRFLDTPDEALEDGEEYFKVFEMNKLDEKEKENEKE